MHQLTDEQWQAVQSIAAIGERLGYAMGIITAEVAHDIGAERVTSDIQLLHEELVTDLIHLQALICGVTPET
jgi:hypothetical protein